MSYRIITLFLILTVSTYSSFVYSEDESKEAPEKSNVIRGGEPLNEQELDKSIGRYGEVDEVPEDFEFATAETKLWLDHHLGNINEPLSLYYEFVKSGTYEDGFTDSVYLKIIELNEDGSKNTLLDFFTAERKQAVNKANVTGVVSNPVVGVYMTGDVYDMARITGGKSNRYRHFLKAIKVALRESASVEATTFTYNGKEYSGEKVSFTPYVNDPHRRDFEQFADKYYEFIFSDQIPGKLYQIKTVVRDKADETADPLVQETLRLIDVKNLDS